MSKESNSGQGVKINIASAPLNTASAVWCEMRKSQGTFLSAPSGFINGSNTFIVADGKDLITSIAGEFLVDVVFSLYESSRDKLGNEYNLKTGHYYYTDVTKPHAVRNESAVDRIHLVVDCYSNDALRTLISSQGTTFIV